MAFVSGATLTRAGRGVSSVRTDRRCAVVMSLGEELSRRQVLLGALAAMLPAAAVAKSGDAPSYSIFGGDSQSSPFTYMDKQKGSVLYKALNESELAFIKNKLIESRERLADTDEFIAGPSWDDVRGEIRLQMYEFRHNILKLANNIVDDKRADKAKKLYEKLKKDMEELDYACTVKDQGRAKKARSAALKSFDQWADIAGLDTLDQ
eukprot:Plantae.Rhodophyta-Purpureofilum_apyrenoidigerum.ctg22645.p2 GENE.Plantae.Rhodophyta-Purpureofilum_apyrenoidigerum.ctg22645~~Plantae.Rhodophyta-Purpureofilum_apyrenoidigerum.ctg22645.p2  ORF type:complete len:207 (-),score=56.41 Plantae.Rhodophyta-Purpureofilum_apyrenoidigerum.ctg22645:193-813(-)